MPSSGNATTSSGRKMSDTGSGQTEPLHQVKLLAALRSGDPALIHPFLDKIGRTTKKEDDQPDAGAAALHLAIRVASLETVKLLLSYRAISPNGVHPPGSGTTALHLASTLGRTDVVNLLLEQHGIDDSVADSNGKTCKEVARGKDTVRAIEDSRALLNATFRSELHSYIGSPLSAIPSSSLTSLLESPRVKFVNLSYLDDDSGLSLLHEAAKRKDLRLIELAVRAGADVFVRNRKGKMAYEGTGKDDRVRVFLRQFANQDNSLIQPPPPTSSEPPALKGYLNKYTNVAKGYNTRWFVLKGGVLSYYRHQEDETVASRGSISMKNAILKTSAGSDKLRFEVHSTPSKGHQSSGVQKWYMKANHPVEASRWTQAVGRSIEWYKKASDANASRGSFDSAASSVRSLTSVLRRTATGGSKRMANQSEAESMDEDNTPPELHKRHDDVDDERAGSDDGSDYDDSFSTSARSVPHSNNFELHGNALAAQLELSTQLVSKQEAADSLKESLSVAQSMLNEYTQMAKDREDWWKRKADNERRKQQAWEESLATVVREGETLEAELRTRSRRRRSRSADTDDAGLATVRQKPSAPTSPPILEESFSQPPPPLLSTLRSETQDTIMPSPPAQDVEGYDTDDEDEFFDAIESNNLPNLEVPASLISPTQLEHVTPPDATLPYVGYQNLRKQLLLKNERPPTSLWSVLKHSIGKDLTKISFPVFFNEPTSMLQRMAEDMEFSECLDIAAKDRDSLRRIAFVAAFAMSNYSSTIGRIAKPFNPMLGETFEYVRLDKEFRYVSEQVSHHPPISACWSESPFWRYYGEVDAQNKFMGKSFEIRPTGVAHAELLLPVDWAPEYPKATVSVTGEERASEHYSWKKVTTNVSGFILGSPTIDHYGDMTVTNHRTGEQCILTFKPRGWRGKDAYEISGKVLDAQGRAVYDIAGRWNSQLIARKVGTTAELLNPDAAISPSHTSNSEHVLLWRNTEKPEGSPFNLTPFAITLNDCPRDTLKPYLCPTDCRLRPDQRAFELGKYEEANQLKGDQEDFQRATRRAREEGKVKAHRARWFTAETDGDTGERVWAPVRSEDGNVEYWREREKVWRQAQSGFAEWKDVDPIFIEEPEYVKNAA